MVTLTSAPATTEHGYAHGGGTWWSQLDEETPELQWPASIPIYDRMRRQDSQVISVLRAVGLPVRRTRWRLEPNGARDEVVELVATDLGLPIVGSDGDDPPGTGRGRDRFSWAQHLTNVLLVMPFGHMPFEQLYRIDEVGRARLRKLAPRMPRTISRFNVARDGGLDSIEQYPPAGAVGAATAKVTIGIDRLVMYVNDREGGQWIGTSLLRPAYKNWVIKDRLLRVQAQTVERQGMGVPWYTGGEHETDLAKGEAIARGTRAGDNAGGAGPHGSKLDLVGVSGNLPDADKPIRYHDEQIARAVLAHFLNLGTQTGSWALGTTFADFFTLGLQSLGQQIADTTTHHVVEDLVDLNWGIDERAPRVVFDEIGQRIQDVAEATDAIAAATGDRSVASGEQS